MTKARIIAGASFALAAMTIVATVLGQKEPSGKVPTLDACVGKLEARKATLSNSVISLQGEISRLTDRMNALTARVAALEARPAGTGTGTLTGGGGASLLAQWPQQSAAVSMVNQANPGVILQRGSFEITTTQDVIATAMVEAAAGSDGGGATITVNVKTAAGQVRCGTSGDPRGSATGGVSMFTFPTTVVATCPRLAPGSYVVEVGAGFRPGANANSSSFYSAKFVAGNVVGLH